MLAQLLQIKQRRESRLRRQIAQTQQEEQQQRLRQQQIGARRQALYAEWRLQAAQAGQLSKLQLDRIRCALSRLEAEAHALTQQTQVVEETLAALAVQRAEYEQQLRQNLREQEKLELLQGSETPC